MGGTQSLIDSFLPRFKMNLTLKHLVSCFFCYVRGFTDMDILPSLANPTLGLAPFHWFVLLSRIDAYLTAAQFFHSIVSFFEYSLAPSSSVGPFAWKLFELGFAGKISGIVFSVL